MIRGKDLLFVFLFVFLLVGVVAEAPTDDYKFSSENVDYKKEGLNDVGL